MLWSEHNLHSAAIAINNCSNVDRRLLTYDIIGSIAHVSMLKEQSIISIEVANKIIDALNKIQESNSLGELDEEQINASEDIHTFIEELLIKMIGEDGKHLHTARSRNDQIATDLRLYLRDEVDKTNNLIINIITTILKMANKHEDSIMPGYTHLQRAQPVSLAHYLLAYASMFERDITRFNDARLRMNKSPLGAAALAGTTFNIDPFKSAKLMGFSAPMINSMDAVSDRDFFLDLGSAGATLMMHLSRLCEEIVIFSTAEFGFFTLSPLFSTGSSIMPQKKNADIAELIRAKAGRVYGDLFALYASMKSLPLSYNKDMQELKESIFSIFDNLKLCLSACAPMLETLEINTQRMELACKLGYLNATDVADFLVRRGLAFREGYKIAAELVEICVKRGISLEELTLEDFKAKSPLFDEEIYAAINIKHCLKKRSSYGAPVDVKSQINHFNELLKDLLLH